LDTLFPEGITKILELPWTITRAIEHAKTVLSWYEHLSDEDRPPKSIWMDDQKLKKWFDSRFGKKGRGNYDQFVQVD